ncbi:MAG: hypothetical protein IE909_10415 [Campylobacterales bacterium]|nr:hypothetical protein [Campylobacterales bacterium]
MKKIMLIDDRTERQEKFCKETGINLDEYSDILDNFTANDYEKLLEDFKSNDFSIIEKYEVIITHRSAFGDLNYLVNSKFKELCKQKNKSIVFFSGGISSISIKNSPFEHLLLNSKKFYSNNLKLFLELSKNNKPNLLVLAFGENWKINLLLNSLEKINVYIGKNYFAENITYEEFEDEVHMDLIRDFLIFEQPANDFLKIQDFKELTKNLTNQIKQQVVLHA